MDNKQNYKDNKKNVKFTNKEKEYIKIIENSLVGGATGGDRSICICQG